MFKSDEWQVYSDKPHYLTFVSDVAWDPVELIILFLLLMQFCPHIGKIFILKTLYVY